MKNMTVEERRDVDTCVLQAIQLGASRAREIITVLGVGSGVDHRVLDKSLQRLRIREKVKYTGQKSGWVVAGAGV